MYFINKSTVVENKLIYGQNFIFPCSQDVIIMREQEFYAEKLLANVENSQKIYNTFKKKKNNNSYLL